MECKKSEDNPWVFFCSRRKPENMWADFPVTLPSDDAFTLSRLDEESPYSSFAFRARTYTEARRKKDNEERIFHALQSCMAACRHSTRQYGLLVNGSPRVMFFYPVVVLAGRLMQATLEDGAIGLAEVDSVLVHFSLPPQKADDWTFDVYTIPVFTESAFGTFLDSVEEKSRRLQELLSGLASRAEASGLDKPKLEDLLRTAGPPK